MSHQYDDLLAAVKDIHALSAAEAVMGWDQQVMMPPKGNAARARQMAVLSAVAHEKVIDEKLGSWIEECEADASLNTTQKAMVREIKRDRDKAIKLPTSLVREIAKVTGEAHQVWVEAREQDDFDLFAPHLQKLIDLKKQEAEALGYPEGGVPYDALLDQFERGATVKTLDPVIQQARDIARDATAAIVDSGRQPDMNLLQKGYSESGQERFGKKVLLAMGYDFDAGRLDKAVHPFTTSFDVNDVRITTRYQEDWLPASVFGTIHECGHALYEMGLPEDLADTPLGEAVSLGIHESQSRFWENVIGRSYPFWKHFYPKLKKAFPDQLGAVSIDDFHFAINTVKPSLIRVEADEVTYNLHIVVRYETEKELFSGNLSVADAPAAWNEKMKAYLGLQPDTNRDGVLQDIHWSFGGFGYFPTYLLGNLYAAQWLNALRKDMPDLDNRIEAGNLIPIRDWLREKIHHHGRMYSPDELAEQISGERLNASYYEQYLKERFGLLYDVSW